jgi:hypothetical protein
MNYHAADIEFIQQTVQYYFDGLYNSNLESLTKAFHPKAQIIGHFQKDLLFMTREQFLKLVKNTPSPSANGESYDMKIVSIDITGDEALIKVTDLYLGFRFTDYLSLIKIEGSWVIVNKTFYHEPKEPR